MKVSEVGTLIDLSILLEDKENNTKNVDVGRNLSHYLNRI